LTHLLCFVELPKTFWLLLGILGLLLRFSAVIVGAGHGARAGCSINKVIVRICGKPLLDYVLEAFASIPGRVETVLVISPADRTRSVFKGERLKRFGVSKVVIGGERRSDSVAAGVRAASCEAELILIHDAARPFVSRKKIIEVLKAAQRVGGAILAVPASDTLKSGTDTVRATVARERLWQAQTPQVFRRELILEAIEKFGSESASDDSQLVERLGARVAIVKGETTNIKITTPEDVALAKKLLPIWRQ
jgi:2-C-methyl-D-erythritol 4-phosphate cytidylyltransferase